MSNTTIYYHCNEYGGAEEVIEDLQNKLNKPLYIKVDRTQDNDVFVSIESFTLLEAKKLQRQGSTRVVDATSYLTKEGQLRRPF